MGKRRGGGNYQKKDNTKRSRRLEDTMVDEDMDDEIDAFHKQRDIVPLDINEDLVESDEDDELPVFDVEDNDEDGINHMDDDNGDEEDENANDDVAKMVRQKRYLRAKFGEVHDEMHDNDDGEEEDWEDSTWGAQKHMYYGADNRDLLIQSSDEDDLEWEAREARYLQMEKAKSLTEEDFGLEDISIDESDRELTLEEISAKGTGTLTREGMGIISKDIKDFSALSKEDQMDILHSSAPELVGLLSELNKALEELESKINPLLLKVKDGQIAMEGGHQYFEMKQLLLLSYCQAITFYLLLKSEGQSARDHPVIARLVGIKSLLDKMKQFDDNLPFQPDDILKRINEFDLAAKLGKENATLASDSFTKDQEPQIVSIESKEAVPQERVENLEIQETNSAKDNVNKAGKDKIQMDKVGVQSLAMLKVRAALEDKLRQKSAFSCIAPDHGRAGTKGSQCKQQTIAKANKKYTRKLETSGDYDDDVAEGASGLNGGLSSTKILKFRTTNQSKSKIASGDDDLHKRDDIGERRRKFELRVLAGAGINNEDGVDNNTCDLGNNPDNVISNSDDARDETEGSEDDLYKQVKQQRDAKLAAKAKNYLRLAAVPSLPETVDGKRHISYQMEKNRGLTRNRKKDTKNPRKNYRRKHQEAVIRRKGQVRDIRKPTGPYGGETTGINASISRSIRFK